MNGQNNALYIAALTSPSSIEGVERMLGQGTGGGEIE